MARSRPEPHVTECACVAFRYSNYDSPFWARPNTDPGRWHQAGEQATQYLACEPAGAWAELARAEHLRTEKELALVRMPIWAARVHQQGIVDYRDFDRAEAAGFAPDALVDDDYARCQAEGTRLRRLGYRGVLAPSAALPGALNLTLFGPRVMSSWARAPRLASSVPATVVAVGSPPPGLADRVRLHGLPHEGYARWREGRGTRSRRPRA